MAKPFETRQLNPTPFLRRLFRKKWKKNTLVEINNLFAAAARIEDVTSEQLERVAIDYGVDLHKEFLSERQEMFGELLQHCLTDCHLDDAETRRLIHIRRLVWLHQSDVETVERRVAKAVYERSVDEVLADGCIDDEERAFLGELQETLRLPIELARSVVAMKAQELLQKVLNESISDQRLSPEEDDEFQILAKNLGVTVINDENTTRDLNRFRLYWKLENGELPEIEPDIKLPRGEICHISTDVDWYEHRTVTTRVGYSGPTARIRIAKGIYWRIGDLAVQRTTEDEMKLIDSGTCYLTSKRVLFRGGRGNKTIPIDRIINVEIFTNGVKVEKDRGKSPFLEFEPGSDVFSMILDRVIDQTA